MTKEEYKLIASGIREGKPGIYGLTDEEYKFLIINWEAGAERLADILGGADEGFNRDEFLKDCKVS